MAAQVNITAVDAAGQFIIVCFNVVLTGAYPTNGDPLNFTGSGTLPVAADPGYVGPLPAVESSNLLQVDVWSQGRGSINGANSTNYDPSVTKSGTPATINPQTGVKLVVAALQAQGTAKDAEHTASNYEAAYLNDIITGQAVFTKLL